ncbi:MAG: ABC transporter permease [Vicinamibacteria bacterium]|nr:ABC transporter permease [Vicinamibacteria bacterium]
MMTDWFTEIRFAVRRLAKAPGFTLAAAATLAIGIGATTAIFSVASAVLLRPLPYPEPERLVSVSQLYREGLGGVGEPKFLFWREKSRSFEALACYSQYGGASGNLSGGTAAEFVNGLRVSLDFFKALGVSPSLGRAFVDAEDVPGAEKVAIISDGLWQRTFGGDPGIVGRTVRLNDVPLKVIGVMPPAFRVGTSADLLMPMQARPTANYDPNATVVGRLKDGVPIDEAKAEMALIAAQYRAAQPRFMEEGESASVQPYRDLFTEGLGRVLSILLGAVSFLLLIACANVAHLQLSRAAARQKEFALRSALGGGRGRIASHLATESLLVSLAAGAVGIWIAASGTRILVRLMPTGYLPELAEVTFDWRVLGFALIVAILAGLAAALAPMWQTRTLDVSATLKDGGGRGGTSRGRLRAALIVTELALSLSLLAGAFLLTRTFANLLDVAPGFDPQRVLTLQVAPSGPRYDTTAKTAAFFQDALDRVTRLPGVRSAAVINKLPLDWQFNMPVTFSDQPEKAQSVQVRMVTADYFSAMGIPVRVGRAFAIRDDASAPSVIIVNDAFARKFLAGRLPFARGLSVGRGFKDPTRDVIGVVGDIKQSGLSQNAPPMVFMPLAQVPDRLMGTFRAFTPTQIAVKVSVDPQTLLEGIRREIALVDPGVAVANVSSMEDLTARSVAPQRFNMFLVSVFSGVALFLALVGVYGVMSYGVTQQSREIGVRVALGATSRDVLQLVVGQGLRLALLGSVVGSALFMALAGVLQGLLYEVSARDPLVLLAAASSLFFTALLASYLPARRAALVDPMDALRAE